VEEFRSSGDAASFSAGVTDLHLGDGAKLLYVSVQDLSPASTSIQVQSAVVGRDASAMSLGVHLGSRFARSESLSRLLGEGGRSDMLAVTVADGEQQFDQRTLQDHRVARTASDLLYKNALDDKARAIFSGLIKVEEGAHFTDAYQKVRNLLLSDEAEANSMPGLEINADQVRCTHGATSGQIEPEELFYLRSRGLREKDAQRLIVLGFLQEAADRIGDAALAARIGDLVRDRFGRTHPE
jgi:Fe-S cluster assembly protein SufD